MEDLKLKNWLENTLEQIRSTPKEAIIKKLEDYDLIEEDNPMKRSEVFEGTPGPWFIAEGWLKGHVSISSNDHGAFAQVVGEMEWEGSQKEKVKGNWVYDDWCRRNKALQANARLIANSPEILDALMLSLPYLKEAAKTSGHAFSVYNLARNSIKKVLNEN